VKVLFRKLRAVLGDAIVVSFILPLAAIVAPYFKQDAQPTAGVLQVQRSVTYPLFGAPTVLDGADAPKFALTLNNQPVPLGHLEMRNYSMHNLSGRNLGKADFESPITIKAAPGQRILYVGVNPAPGHAPIKVSLVGDTHAVIDPMLLNIDETASINILLYRENGIPATESPYSDDSGVLAWTADIKGADLSVVGSPRVEMPTTSPVKWIILYTAHIGYGVIALVLTGLALSAFQIKKFGTTRKENWFNWSGTFWLSFRIAYAWVTADTIVRMFDFQFMYYSPWTNWMIIGIYIVTMIFPMPPGSLTDTQETPTDQAARP
jgi:hypothetical protein